MLFTVAIRREGLGRPSLGLLRETISFGVRAWLGTLADSLGFRIDQILLALIASEAALGFYVVAVNLSEILLYFPGAVSTALLPLAARSAAGPRLGQTLRAWRSAMYVTLASIVFSAVVVPPLIPLVFGSAFHASVTPFLLLLPGLIGFTAMIVFCNALIALVAAGPLVDSARRVLRRRDRARPRADSLLRSLGRVSGGQRRLPRCRRLCDRDLPPPCAVPPGRAGGAPGRRLCRPAHARAGPACVAREEGRAVNRLSLHEVLLEVST